MAAEPQYIYLTTTGWRSGNPHEVELWFVSHAGRYYLVSGGGDKSHWVQNLTHNPAVTFRVGDQTFPGTARKVPAEEADLATTTSNLMRAKYGQTGSFVIELSPDS